MGISALLGNGSIGGGVIKARGLINLGGTLTGTATIPAVDMSKAKVRYLGQRGTGGALNAMQCTLILASSTQVLAERYSSNGGFDSVIVSYEVEEGA